MECNVKFYALWCSRQVQGPAVGMLALQWGSGCSLADGMESGRWLLLQLQSFASLHSAALPWNLRRLGAIRRDWGREGGCWCCSLAVMSLSCSALLQYQPTIASFPMHCIILHTLHWLASAQTLLDHVSCGSGLFSWVIDRCIVCMECLATADCSHSLLAPI